MHSADVIVWNARKVKLKVQHDQKINWRGWLYVEYMCTLRIPRVTCLCCTSTTLAKYRHCLHYWCRSAKVDDDGAHQTVEPDGHWRPEQYRKVGWIYYILEFTFGCFVLVLCGKLWGKTIFHDLLEYFGLNLLHILSNTEDAPLKSLKHRCNEWIHIPYTSW